MNVAFAALVIAGLLPLGLALRANRRTSLAHALVWAILAWASWTPAIFFEEAAEREAPPLRYCALSLTACAGVAVLGARRPHVGAWNFVVLGLLTVMLLPLLEAQLIGTRSTEGLRVFFLGATIAVGALNYLPTRLVPAALLLLLVCETHLLGPLEPWLLACMDAVLATVPWVGWVFWWRRKDTTSVFDRLWLDFRDRWGLVWSQRVREQFDNAAQNAGWPVKLGWRGLTIREEGPSSGGDEEKYLETLKAILQRFLAAD